MMWTLVMSASAILGHETSEPISLPYRYSKWDTSGKEIKTVPTEYFTGTCGERRACWGMAAKSCHVVGNCLRDGVPGWPTLRLMALPKCPIGEHANLFDVPAGQGQQQSCQISLRRQSLNTVNFLTSSDKHVINSTEFSSHIPRLYVF